jgi:hypothetical protein
LDDDKFMNFKWSLSKNVFVILVVSFILGLSGCGISENIPDELKLRLQKGDQFVTEQQYTLNKSIGNNHVFYERLLIQTYEVIATPPNGPYEFKVTWRRARFHFPLNDSPQSVDSKHDTLSVDLSGLESPDWLKTHVMTQLGLIGKSYVIHIQPNRNVKRVEGFERLGSTVSQRIRNNRSINQERITTIKAMFNPETKLKDLKKSSRVLRNARLQKGETWNITRKRNLSNFPTLVNQTYSYKGLYDTGFKFRADDSVKLNQSKLPIKHQGWTTNYEGSGRLKQLIYVDSETGMKILSNTREAFQGTKTITPPEQPEKEWVRKMDPRTDQIFYRYNHEIHFYPVKSLSEQTPKFTKLEPSSKNALPQERGIKTKGD